MFDKDLILMGITGIKDPLRPSIKDAIEKCHHAGITVRMVTGDNLITAIAISKEANILPSNYVHSPDSYKCMEGFHFRELCGGLVYDHPEEADPKKKGECKIKNFDVFRKIANQLSVLARSTPDDKYMLVTGLKALDNVVAVTGDGTNDAPALKKAHVGFAMGTEHL